MKNLNFIAIDFETANEKRTSAISVGVVPVVNGVIQKEKSFYTLIDPIDRYFNPFCTRVHGLTEKDIDGAPCFKEVWNNHLKEMIEGQLVVIHNSSMDISIIRQSVDFFELDPVQFNYLCTMNTARKLNVNVPKYTLDNLCKCFQIELNNYHNALEDATVTAALAIKLSQIENFLDVANIHCAYESAQLPGSVPNEPKRTFIPTEKSQKIRGELLKPALDDVQITNNPFFNKKVVISGTYNEWPDRKDLAKILKKLGADIDSDVTAKTNYLCAGMGAGPSKRKKMEKNIADGNEAWIIFEDEIIEMLIECYSDSSNVDL